MWRYFFTKRHYSYKNPIAKQYYKNFYNMKGRRVWVI